MQPEELCLHKFGLEDVNELLGTLCKLEVPEWRDLAKCSVFFETVRLSTKIHFGIQR